MVNMITIIMVVFALFAFSRAILQIRKGQITRKEFAFWSIVWIGVIVVAFIPAVASSFADFLGIGRGVDVLVYIGILLLFYLVFRIYTKIEQVEQEINTLTKNIAIELRSKKK